MTKITPELLIEAYKIGVFPMAKSQSDPTIEFFDPDPRGIIPLETFHIPRSLRKLIRKGIFKVTFDLLCEAKKTVEWKSYQHDIHGFIFPQKKADGKYLPDEVQLEAINDIISFIDKYMN